MCIYRRLIYQQKQATAGRKKYCDLDKRFTQILRVARDRARRKGLPFDLDTKDILSRVRAGRCEATGLAFHLDFSNETEAQYSRNPFMPSLDRIDSRRGYTKDNVQVVCLGWNLMKASFDMDFLALFIRGWYEKQITEE